MDFNTIIKKVTSRKFILALSGFVTSLVIAFGGNATDATKIVSLITSALYVLGYMLVEGYSDAKAIEAAAEEEETTTAEE